MLSSFILCFPRLISNIIIYFLFSKVFWIFFSLYAIGCYFLVLYIFSQTKKYREDFGNNKAAHKKYEMFKRRDFKFWDKNKLFLGALFCLWIKIPGILFSLFFCYLGLKIFIKKTDDKNNPEVKKKINLFSTWGPKIFLFFMGIKIKFSSAIDINYSNYLNDKIEENIQIKNENKNKEIIPSIYISNHTSWLDIVIYMSLFGCGFLSKSDVKNFPFIGLIAQSIGCLFVDRNNKDKLEHTVNLIVEKQKNILEKKDLSKFMIFPEGTTTNNSGIIDFKRGAFISETPIKPLVIKFSGDRISLSMDIIEMLYHVYIILAVPFHEIEIIELPNFVPNEYILKNEEIPRWKQFADIVRKAMCDASNLKSLSGDVKTKNEYLKILRGVENVDAKLE